MVTGSMTMSQYLRKLSTASAVAIAGAIATSLLDVSPVSAAPIEYTGLQGSLAASVSFEIIATNLSVTLTNISTADVLIPANVLTGVGFTLAGNPTLSVTSAVLKVGSSVFYDPD